MLAILNWPWPFTRTRYSTGKGRSRRFVAKLKQEPAPRNTDCAAPRLALHSGRQDANGADVIVDEHGRESCAASATTCRPVVRNTAPCSSLAQRLEEMDGNPTTATDSIHSGPERRTRGVQEPKPGPKTTAQARVCTLEPAVAVHDDEIEYGTGKGTIAVQ